MSSLFSYRHLSALLPFLFSLLLTACVKDKPEQPDPGTIGRENRKMYIANEGSLGNGNASFSVYDLEEAHIYNDVYRQKNNQGLGDIFQSLIRIDSRIFMAINNSDRITVIDQHDYSLVAHIPLAKPRFMLQVRSDKMYVSSLYHPVIHIVNLHSLQVTGSIRLDYPNTEGLLLLQGKVYACNWDTACNYLYEIDPVTDQISNRILLAGYAPTQVLADKHQQLWVLSGDVLQDKTAYLSQVDPVSGTLLKSYAFPPGAEIMKATWNRQKDTLYYLSVKYDGSTVDNGVFRLPIASDGLPEQSFIPAKPFQYFWGLGIDPRTGLIYVGDPKGFIQKGTVHIYDGEAQLLRSVEAGIGPGYFDFEE